MALIERVTSVEQKVESLDAENDNLRQQIVELKAQIDEIKSYAHLFSENARLILNHIRVANINPNDEFNNQRYKFSFSGPNGNPNRGFLRALKLQHYVGNEQGSSNFD
jgi:hypothetical protein